MLIVSLVYTSRPDRKWGNSVNVSENTFAVDLRIIISTIVIDNNFHYQHLGEEWEPYAQTN